MTSVEMTRAGVTDARRDDLTVLPAVLRRTVWGAIFIGAITAIGVQVILTVLGVAIGVSSVDQADSAATVGVAASIWWLVTGIISLLAGGTVLGRTAGIQRSVDVLLHAFAMWATTAVAGIFLVWATASVAVTAGSNAAASVAWNPGYIAQHRGSLASGVEGPLGDVIQGGDRAGTTRAAEANDGRNAGALREQPTAGEVEEARKATRTASWWVLIGLVMGIGAALCGTWIKAPRRLMVRPLTVAAP